MRISQLKRFFFCFFTICGYRLKLLGSVRQLGLVTLREGTAVTTLTSLQNLKETYLNNDCDTIVKIIKIKTHFFAARDHSSETPSNLTFIKTQFVNFKPAPLLVKRDF